MEPDTVVGEAPVRCVAPAKINLYLHVTGRRGDGYHELDSLVVFAGIGDGLEAYPAEDLTLALSGPFASLLTESEDNLVLRAARLLAEWAGVPAAADIRLEKVLPVGAGIGGGSADAAAALHALAALWRLRPGDGDLARLGLALGADVPACLARKTAYIGGIGEVIEAAPPLPALHLVLVNPGIMVETAEVFRLFRGPMSVLDRFHEAPSSARALTSLLASRRNDLLEPACRVAPAIADVIEALESQPDCLLARLSGSGATCFAVFESGEKAARAAEAIRAERAGWWVVSTPLLADRGAKATPG